MLRRIRNVIIIIVIILTTIAPHPLWAQSTDMCFAETQQCISGPIKTYWQTNGGLAVFGYPITAQRYEVVEGRTLLVQWFERDRLEIQTDGLVTAGRLGARVLELTNQPWQFGSGTMPAAEQTSHGNSRCRLFAETGYALCVKFYTYWEQNGGLARFGYPIGNETLTQIDGQWLWVQYFERRRMEYHPELADTPYEILLGLLGTTVYNTQMACIQSLIPAMMQAYQQLTLKTHPGCPTLMPATDVAASRQTFEYGEMLWFDHGPYQRWSIGPRIFAIITTPRWSFRVFGDTWSSQTTQPVFAPPPQRYAPWRGFGLVWQQNPMLVQHLGWATEPTATPFRINYQLFDGGVLMVHIPEYAVVYAFGDATDPTDMQIIGVSP
ncbi:MAG: hypothetical protein ACK5XN_36560 [Bacteroidota bacterium]